MEPDKNTVWAPPAEREKAGAPKAPPRVTTKDAWLVWRANPSNPKLTGDLIDRLEPTIDSALQTVAPDNKKELRAKALTLALKAAGSYDPAKGVELSTHVFNNLKSLYRVNAERSNVIHIPENVLLDANKLNKIQTDMEADLGRPVDLTELADRTGLSVKRINYVRGYRQPLADSQVTTDKGDSRNMVGANRLKIWSDYVYNDLGPVDRKIFEGSSGYNGAPVKQKQTIAEELGISGSAVSQRLRSILDKLKMGFKSL